MTGRTEIAQRFIEAQRSRDNATIDALAEHLADDAVYVNPRVTVSGREAIVEQLKNPPQGPGAAMAQMITWNDPVEEGDTVRVNAVVPPNPMVTGVIMNFEFGPDDKVRRIESVVQRG